MKKLMMKLTGLETWTKNDTVQVVLALSSGVVMIGGICIGIARIGV